AFGELRALLEERGLWSRTVVVVLADHGEEFHEHGDWEHGHSLHAESVRIPLLVRVPGVAPRRVRMVAQQVDLLPTLLDLAGATPPELEGASLVPTMLGAVPELPRVARSYARFDDRDEAAVTSARFRLLLQRPRARAGERVLLYDRVEDPLETEDRGDRFPIARAYLLSVLRWPSGVARTLAEPAALPGDEGMAQLRA